MKVLVVDDDDVLRNELSELLNNEGYKTFVTDSGEATIKMLRHQDFDLIFTDLRLPDMSGMELLKLLRKLNINTRVIMITAYSSTETAVEAMKNGAVDFLCKPIEVEHLKSTLKVMAESIEYEKQINHVKMRGTLNDPVKYFKSLTRDSHGLFITQCGPKMIEDKYDLNNVSMLWLTPEVSDESCIDPKRLSDLKLHLELFFRENPEGVALFEGIEALLKQHPWEVVKKFLLDISTNAVLKPSRLIITAEREKIEDETFSELKCLISNPYVHIISESLSNPIRRDIVRILSNNNISSFTEILKELGIKDAPKLSFHLKKLVDHKILQKNGKIGYSLTDRGKSTAICLEELERNAMCDFQNNVLLILNESKKKDSN